LMSIDDLTTGMDLIWYLIMVGLIRVVSKRFIFHFWVSHIFLLTDLVPQINDYRLGRAKDLKEGYGFESLDVNNFWPTEAVLTMIALVFHNLIVYLNRTILNPNRAQQQLKSLRHKYFTLPGQLGSGGRSYVLPFKD